MINKSTNFWLHPKDLQAALHTVLYLGEDYDEKSLLTIIITTYNRPFLLKESLDSAYMQNTVYKYNILVVDNCSDERLPADFFVNREYKNLKYVRNNSNLGMFGNMNQGIAIAETKYLSFLHDDDLYSPLFVQSVIELIKKKPFQAFHVGIEKIFNKKEIVVPKDCSGSLKKLKDWQMIFNGPGAPTGLVVNRTCIKDLGGFNVEYHPTSDYCMGVLLSHYYSYYIFSKVLCYYRVAENESMNVNTLKAFVHNDFYLREFIFNHYSIPSMIKSNLHGFMIYDQIDVLRRNYNNDFVFDEKELLKSYRRRNRFTYLICRLLIEAIIRVKQWI